MICDKCGGLVVRIDEDEGKCLGCSKRFWRPDETMGFCHQPGCEQQTKGAYCSNHSGELSAKDSVVRPEHAPKAPVVIPTRCAVIEKPVVQPNGGKESVLTAPRLPSTAPLLPEEIKFVFAREQNDFQKFAIVWGLKFPEYELDTVVENKEDETKVNVWLRRKATP